MPNRSDEYNNTLQQDEAIDKGEEIQRLLYRILPYWPLILFVILLSVIAARIYLRYAVPVYMARARVIVHDETQQKSANIQEILQLDTRNLSSETEKEMQILSSRDLLTQLAIKLQLNVNYFQKGRLRTAPSDDDNIPFFLELEAPETIKRTVIGEAVRTDQNKIIFNGQTFSIDSLEASPMGNIRWRLNNNFSQFESIRKIQVTITPISSAVSNLKGSLKIDPISKQSAIVDLTYSDPIPLKAVTILNQLLAIYSNSIIDYKSRIYENSQKFLDGRLTLIAQELSGVEKDIERYKSKEGITDLSAEGSLYLNQLKVTDSKIAETDIQLEVLDQVYSYVTKRNNTNDSVPVSLGITDPVLTSLLNQLYQAETDLQKVKELSGNKNPQIEVFQDVIKKLKPGIISSVNNLKANLTASKNKMQYENSKMSVLLNKIPSKERLLLDISRQQAIKNEIYTFLLQKREESAIASASIVPNFRVIEKPERGGIVSPVPAKVYSLAFLIAILIAVIYIYLKEFSSKKVLFRSQIEEELPIPVISELIYHENNPDSSIVVGAGKRTLIAEQFRELRTNLNYITANSPNKCKIILSTSSIPKEGKSFVAINAAISLSLTGDKVALLEFDMRKPKISKPLGINSDIGISSYLAGNVEVADIVKPHPTISNMFVLPAGPIPPNPAELMTTDKLTKLFDYLKQHFDYVIIDSPPIAAVTDAKILSPFADATIYIIRHNYTNYVFLNLLNDVYQKRTLKNISVVFNGIKNKKILGYGYTGYGYGYGYGYNYGYGYTIEDSKKKTSIKGVLNSLSFGLFKKKRN